MLLLASTAHLGFECMNGWMDGLKGLKYIQFTSCILYATGILIHTTQVTNIVS